MQGADRGQVASLDLILSVVVFILFIALVIGYVLTIQPAAQIRYGEGIIDRIDFVEDRMLDRTVIPTGSEAYQGTLFTNTEYSETSDYCITLDSSSEREELIGTACSTTDAPICGDMRGIDRYVTHVLDDNIIKRLTLWVCI